MCFTKTLLTLISCFCLFSCAHSNPRRGLSNLEINGEIKSDLKLIDKSIEAYRTLAEAACGQCGFPKLYDVSDPERPIGYEDRFLEKISGADLAFMKHEITPVAGLLYLRLYDLTNDPKYLSYAKELGDQVLKYQSLTLHGGWAEWYLNSKPAGESAVIDDNVTYNAVLLLLASQETGLSVSKEDLLPAIEKALSWLDSIERPADAVQGTNWSILANLYSLDEMKYPSKLKIPIILANAIIHGGQKGSGYEYLIHPGEDPNLQYRWRTHVPIRHAKNALQRINLLTRPDFEKWLISIFTENAENSRKKFLDRISTMESSGLWFLQHEKKRFVHVLSWLNALEAGVDYLSQVALKNGNSHLPGLMSRRSYLKHGKTYFGLRRR